MCNSASVQKMLKSFVSLLWKNTFCPSLSWLNYEIGELDQLRWGNLINKFHDILCHMETYLVIFNHISSYSYISCNIESHPHWFHKTVAKYNQFYVNDRVLDHQMWFPLDLRAAARKGNPICHSHFFHSRKTTNCACWRHWDHPSSIPWHQSF